jgi:hypothetical protein
MQKAPINNLIKRFSKTVYSYILSTNVLKYKLAIVYLILNVIVVDINVFSTLIVALTCNKLERRLVITIELNRIDVFTCVTNLLEELLKLGSFLSSVYKANVLSFSSRSS